MHYLQNSDIIQARGHPSVITKNWVYFYLLIYNFVQETEKEKHLLFSFIYSKIHSLWPKVLCLTKSVVYIYHHNHTKILMSKLQKKKKRRKWKHSKSRKYVSKSVKLNLLWSDSKQHWKIFEVTFWQKSEDILYWVAIVSSIIF